MSSERTLYADANGVRIGTTQLVFGQHSYATRNVSSANVVTEERRRWPGSAMMGVGGVLLVIGFLSSPTLLLFGAVAFASGSFYFSRRRPTYAVRIVTSQGAALVLASRQRAYVESVRGAIVRAIDEARDA